jgi:mRNA interferase MazF
MAFSRGDVVLVPFPFTDLSATRVRPAVVVSSSEYEEETGDIILTMVTSRRHEGLTDFALQDWRRSGLIMPSWIRIKLATLSSRLVQFSPGQLSRRDALKVDEAIRTALGWGVIT